MAITVRIPTPLRTLTAGAAEQGDGLEAGGHSADYTIIGLGGIIICWLW